MTFCDRLAAFFQDHQGQWIDGRQLAGVAGAYAWRSRVSDLRKPPYRMAIENRVRSVKEDGRIKFTVSEYRFQVLDAGSQEPR